MALITVSSGLRNPAEAYRFDMSLGFWRQKCVMSDRRITSIRSCWSSVIIPLIWISNEQGSIWTSHAPCLLHSIVIYSINSNWTWICPTSTHRHRIRRSKDVSAFVRVYWWYPDLYCCLPVVNWGYSPALKIVTVPLSHGFIQGKTVTMWTITRCVVLSQL